MPNKMDLQDGFVDYQVIILGYVMSVWIKC